jgi:transposase-like protein
MNTPVEVSDPIYRDEDAARAHLEAIRWPDGSMCPLCGVTDQSRPEQGKSMGKGWYYCSACKKKYTVRVGTIYERSHIPLHKWLLAFRLMASSKKGISAHQLHCTLNITYKSAWFLAHRIRETMRDDNPGPMGGEGEIVEAEETFTGQTESYFENKRGWVKKPGHSGKTAVLTLVQRGGGSRSVVVKNLTTKTLRGVLVRNVPRETRLMTDQA